MTSLSENPINVSDLNAKTYIIERNNLKDVQGKDQYLDIRKEEGVWKCRVVTQKPMGGAYATLNKIFLCLKESQDITDSNKALFDHFVDIIVSLDIERASLREWSGCIEHAKLLLM